MTRKRFLQILTNTFYALGIVVSILFLIIYAFGALYNDDYHSYGDTEMLTYVYMALTVFAVVMLLLCLAAYRCNGIKQTKHKKRNTVLIFLPGLLCAVLLLWVPLDSHRIKVEFKLSANEAKRILERYLRKNRAEVLEDM